MNLIPSGMMKGVAVATFKAKQNSPHIFFGVGIVGVIGSTILACRATLKLEPTIDEIKRDVDRVADDRVIQHDGLPMIVKSDADHAKDVGYVGIKGAIAIGKLYGPAVIVGGIGVACLTGSHVQLTRRNAALTAALTALTKAYDDYRARVREELGDEREMELYRNIKEIEVVGDDGKKALVRQVNPNGLSPYAVQYGPKCHEWQPDAEFNRTFLRVQEQYANHKLNRDGFLLLNDVYESLGLPRTSAGGIVGWLKNSKIGDNYVDFGLYDPRTKDMLNPADPNVWLDFNVDGPVVYDISEL